MGTGGAAASAGTAGRQTVTFRSFCAPLFWVVAAAVATGWVFVAPGYWVFTVSAGLVLAISALGLLVLVGWAGEVSLAQAGLTGTAVYVSGWAARTGDGLGWPFLASAGLGIGVVVALSGLVALATARLSGIYILVLTLAVQVTIEQTVFTSSTLVGGGLEPFSRPALFGVSLHGDRAFYLFTLAVLGGMVLLLHRLRRSRFGRGLLLVGTDRQVASAVGVSPWRAKILAFALAGGCAGVAGALTPALYTASPSFVAYTAFSSLFYLAIPVLAGFRSLLGLVVVAVTFSVVPQALESYRIHPFVLGATGLLLGTLVGRGGVSGLVLDRTQGWGCRRAGSGTVDLRAYEDAVATLEAWVAAPGRPEPVENSGLLAVRDVNVAFGGVQALREVSFVVPAGHLVGLIGSNGAGKTTLFDVISGLRAPDSGQVVLAGRDITALPAWDRPALGISRTFQANRVDLDLSVADNLLTGAYPVIPGNPAAAILGLPGPRRAMRAAESAARAIAVLLDIEQHWDAPAGRLSYGNRRRVEIGRSLMSAPRLLLLDEPSAGLDPSAARYLFDLVARLHQDLGLTVLLVEHDVRAVLEHCSLVLVLGQGQVVTAGRPNEVADHPDVRADYLGADFDVVPGARGDG